jgi:hypothetical protein
MIQMTKHQIDWSRAESLPGSSIRDTRPIVGVDEEPPVPFQFTVNVLCELYLSLLGFRDAGHEDELETGNLEFKVQRLEFQKAETSSLRAIAYFSWNNRDRLFLTRRVFPQFYGFMSYSHVPFGWGALGQMAKEIESTKYCGHTVIKDIHQNDMLLPYLTEATRLKYRSVVAIPIRRPKSIPEVDEPEIETRLLGAVVLYLQMKDCLMGLKRNTFVAFSNKLAMAIVAHSHAIDKRIVSEPINARLSLGRSFRIEIRFKCRTCSSSQAKIIESTLLGELNKRGFIYAMSHPRVGPQAKELILIASVQHGTSGGQVYEAIGQAVCAITCSSKRVAPISWTVRHTLDGFIPEAPRKTTKNFSVISASRSRS